MSGDLMVNCVAFSGGKDSTAMLLKMIEQGIKKIKKTLSKIGMKESNKNLFSF